MERFDPFTTVALVGEERIAAQVDYEVCKVCGFRLMRVETTIINEQRLTVKHCPICEKFTSDYPGSSVIMSENHRLVYFDIWLATHGLDRHSLKQHYHLAVDDFFDLVE